MKRGARAISSRTANLTPKSSLRDFDFCFCFSLLFLSHCSFNKEKGYEFLSCYYFFFIRMWADSLRPWVESVVDTFIDTCLAHKRYC